MISSAVTGTLQPVLTVMPTNLKSMTWAFATGECGSENWAGIQASALASANVQNWVSNGKFYVISTGGAAGVFTCGSDAGFTTFINRYNSSSLLGIDFDIEGGQSQAVITSLVQRVANAERTFPNLRFSFTLATLGGNSPNSLNSLGASVMAAIKASAWDTVIGTLEFDAKGDIKQLDYVVYKWDDKGGYAEINPKGS